VNRNPTIEEQASERIHRMGQTKEVTTVRFFIRDSFEEVSPNSSRFLLELQLPNRCQHVMEVQQSKKDLAVSFLSPHDGGHSNSTRERLQVCKLGAVRHVALVLAINRNSDRFFDLVSLNWYLVKLVSF